MDRKPRIDSDGPSAIQRLKDLSQEEQEFLAGQKSKLSAARLIAMIEARHGIFGLTPQRLSDFWRWLSEQQALRQMNADAATFREAFAKDNPTATLEEAHEATLAWLHLRAARGDDAKLMKFCLIELRKAREGSREDRKIKLLEAKAEEAKKTLSDTTLSPEQQTAKMREVFGLA